MRPPAAPRRPTEENHQDGRSRGRGREARVHDHHRHHLRAGDDDDFNIRTPEELIRAQLAAANVFTLLLGSAASLSLLVGGIGIMNIMLISVTERTREIGIRKALGAPKRAILTQFLIEATLLSVIGGGLGVAIALMGSNFHIAGVEPVIVPSSVGLALGVSVAIGLFFGSYPASRAAGLRPIDALRYE